MRRFPGLLISLLLTCIVSGVFGIVVFGNHRDVLGAIPKFLRQLILGPGMFCWFVVGTFTGSPGWSYAAFAAGTLTVYAGVGLGVDGVRWLLRRSRERSASDDSAGSDGESHGS